MIFIPSSSSNYVSATSYLALDEADQIINSSNDSTEWGALEANVKHFILNQASISVDGLFSYQHKRTDEAQMLKFPRNGATTIPYSVKYAVCSLALSISKDEAFKNVKSETIGKMSLQFYGTFNGATDEIMSYLRPLKMKGVRIN